MRPEPTADDLPPPVAGECLALLCDDLAAAGPILAAWGAREPEAVLLRADDPPLANLDLRRNVAFPLAARGVPRRERHRLVDELLGLAGLDGVANGRAAALPAEFRTRLILARGLATGRRLLLLHGAFEGLPPDRRQELSVLLRRLARIRRIAVVATATDRRDALDAGDRIAVLARGRVLQTGDARALATRPDSPLVAQAIAGANLLTARICQPLDDPPDCDVRLASGETMPATLTGLLDADDPCIVAIRPDRIAFAAMSPDALGGRAVAATLVDHHDFGDHLRLRFRLADGTPLLVHRPAAAIGDAALRRAAEPNGASLAWKGADATAFAPHA